MSMLAMSFSAIDWSIVGVYFLATVVIGLIARSRIHNVEDFLVAGRQVRLNVGIATLFATELGLVTMMYFAQNGFEDGFSAFIIGLVWAAAYMIVGRTGFVITAIRRLKLLTVTEFYERRYNKWVRFMAANLLLIAGVLGMGVFIKLSATFVVRFMGIPPEYINTVMTVLVVVVVLYTALGGMVSVILTDFMQFIVLAAGMLAATAFVFADQGFGRLFDAATTTFKTTPFDPISNPHFGWSYIVFFGIFAIAGTILWQPVAARVLATERPSINKKIFSVVSVLFLSRAFIPILWGIAAAVVLRAGWPAGQPTTDAMPMYLRTILPIGIAGIFVAGMFAAEMSTYSAYMVSWGGVVAQDIAGPLTNNRMSDTGRIWTTRIVVVVVGILMLVFGVFYELKISAFNYLLDACMIYYAGAFPVIALGVYWKRTTSFGAFMGFAMGALPSIAYIVLDLIIVGQGGETAKFLPKSGWLPVWLADIMISTAYRGLLCFGLGTVGVILGSMISGTPKELVYPDEIEKKGQVLSHV